MTRPLPNEILMLRWSEPRGNGEYVQRRRFYTNVAIATHRRDLLKADRAMTSIDLNRVSGRWEAVL